MKTDHRKNTWLSVWTLIVLGCNYLAAQPNTVFFLENFTGGFPTGWNVTDNSGNGVNWKHTFTGAANSTSQPFPSSLSTIGTTAADGYMVYDSDSSGQSVGGEDADLTSPRIDCLGKTNVHLSFNHLLVHLNEIARIYVSTDSTSWIEVARPSDSLASYGTSPNPELFDIDISALTDSQANVWIRFNYFGDYDFWWMIDDVKLYEEDESPDLAVLGVISPESSCSGSTTNETVTILVQNHGRDTAYGFDIGFTLDNGPTIIEYEPDTLLPGGIHTYSFVATVDLSIPSVHRLLTFVSCQDDDHIDNDTLARTLASGPFPGNNFINSFETRTERTGWSITDGNNDGTVWSPEVNRPWDMTSVTGDSCMALEVQTTSSFANDWLVSPCIELYDTIQYQTSFLARAENDSCDGFVQIVLLSDSDVASVIHVISPLIYVSDSSYSAISTLPFQPNLSGTYHLGIHGLSAGRRASIRIDRFKIEDSMTTDFHDIPAAKEPYAYPNPFRNRLSIRQGFARRFSIQIRNMEGKTLFKTDEVQCDESTIDTADFPAGIYCLELHDGEDVTRQIIVKQ